jgi:hypothetical protein
MISAMVLRRNMADPSYEPSDEDLRRLSAEAFAHVAADTARGLSLVRERIALARREVLEKLTREGRDAS